MHLSRWHWVSLLATHSKTVLKNRENVLNEIVYLYLSTPEIWLQDLKQFRKCLLNSIYANHFFSTIPFSGVLKTAELRRYFNLLFSVNHSVLWNWGPLVGSLSRFLCYQLLWLLTCRCWRKKSWIFIANCSLSLGSWVLWKKGLSKVGHTHTWGSIWLKGG